MNRDCDRALLKRLPDDGAMREIYSRYSRLVYSTCLGVLRRQDLAEDATQSVFLILLAKASVLECGSSLAPWLYVTALRTAKSLARHERNRQKHELDAASQPKPRHESHGDLLSAIARLGRTEQQLLLLKHVQGMTYEEVGKELGLTQDATRMRINRVHTKLRQKLGESYSVAALITSFSQESSHLHWSQPTALTRSVRLDSSRGVPIMQGLFRLVSVSAFVACLGIMFHLGGAQQVGAPPKAMPYLFKTPTGPYRLTYDYQRSEPGSKATRRGSLTITEAGNALMLQADDPTQKLSVVYRQGRTLSIAIPKGRKYDPTTTSASYLEGFNTGPGVAGLKLPFNFRAVSTFQPLQVSIDQLNNDKTSNRNVVKKLKEILKNSNSNLSVITSRAVNSQGYVDATFRLEGDEATLVYGASPLIWGKLRYSGLTDHLGVPVPTHIEFVNYGFNSLKATSTVPIETFVLDLKSVESDQSHIQTPTPEAVLPKGQWVSYNGYGRKSAGVMFDPNNKLDAQVEAQLRSH